MRFSRRTGWNTEESVLARAHRLRVQSSQPIADITASNPTRCGFVYSANLLQSLAQPQALEYDPQPRGSLTARQAVCRYYADLSVEVSPEKGDFYHQHQRGWHLFSACSAIPAPASSSPSPAIRSSTSWPNSTMSA